MALTEMYVSASAGGSGGGLSEGDPFSFQQMMTQIAAGNGRSKRYNIKVGTYTRTNDDDTGSYNGTQTQPIILRGYNTTPGDGYLGRTNGNGPLILTNMPLISYSATKRWKNGEFWMLETLRFSFDVGNLSPELNGYSAMVGCVITNANNSDLACPQLGNGCFIFNNDISNTALTAPSGTPHVVILGGEGIQFDSNRIISTNAGARHGIRIQNKCTIINNLFKGAAGAGNGIRSTSTDTIGTIRNNTIVGWNKAIELMTATKGLLSIVGNMITDNTIGINLPDAANGFFVGRNRFRDNGTNIAGTVNDWILASSGWPSGHVTTDTGGPETDYVNASSSDYRLIDASPGIESNVLPSQDMGAYQREKGAGGGSAAVFHPLTNFIIRPA